MADLVLTGDFTQDHTLGPVVTLSVGSSSVGFLAASLKPAVGKLEGKVAQKALIMFLSNSVYMEAGGGDATNTGFQMASGSTIVIEGYDNIRNLRFLQNSGAASAVALFGYR